MLVASDDLIDLTHTHPFIADGSPRCNSVWCSPVPASTGSGCSFNVNGVVNTAHFDVAVRAPASAACD